MKPGDFLLGVLDFFAILLPGSLATWLATRYLQAEALRSALSLGNSPSGPDRWALVTAFLVSSYILGHFVFMAGARLDASYDRWRKRSKPVARDKAYQMARRVQEQLTKEIVDAEFTTLKWAKAYIEIESPQARTEIDRLEADSKFFRSLVIVMMAFAAHFLLHERVVVAGAVAFVMALMSYARYVEQRWKMTELSYATAVIVFATKARQTQQQAGLVQPSPG